MGERGEGGEGGKGDDAGSRGRRLPRRSNEGAGSVLAQPPSAQDVYRQCIGIGSHRRLRTQRISHHRPNLRLELSQYLPLLPPPQLRPTQHPSLAVLPKESAPPKRISHVKRVLTCSFAHRIQSWWYPDKPEQRVQTQATVHNPVGPTSYLRRRGTRERKEENLCRRGVFPTYPCPRAFRISRGEGYTDPRECRIVLSDLTSI